MRGFGPFILAAPPARRRAMLLDKPVIKLALIATRRIIGPVSA
jgi:hypothetical protein